VFIGIASYWLVHDFPDDAKFLSDDDRKRVLRRLKADGQSSAEHEEFKMAYFWASVKDWKTWAFAIIYMGCDGSLYAFSLFLPSIVQQLYPGISSTRANLLSVPPYAGKFSTLRVEVRTHACASANFLLSRGHRDSVHRLACRPHQGPWTV
jgi:hypothetical protein